MLRGEHRSRINVEPLCEDELQEQQRADVADVVDRLEQPVDRVRDVRSLLLLKLVFAERLGVDARPMLAAEQDAIAASIAVLEARMRVSGGTEEILLRFRLESTRAVLRFVEGVLADERVAAKAAV